MFEPRKPGLQPVRRGDAIRVGEGYCGARRMAKRGIARMRRPTLARLDEDDARELRLEIVDAAGG